MHARFLTQCAVIKSLIMTIQSPSQPALLLIQHKEIRISAHLHLRCYSHYKPKGYLERHLKARSETTTHRRSGALLWRPLPRLSIRIIASANLLKTLHDIPSLIDLFRQELGAVEIVLGKVECSETEGWTSHL